MLWSEQDINQFFKNKLQNQTKRYFLLITKYEIANKQNSNDVSI